jgi:hypothetical protein
MRIHREIYAADESLVRCHHVLAVAGDGLGTGIGPVVSHSAT